MEDETNNILYQRAKNIWSKKSIYTIKLLPYQEVGWGAWTGLIWLRIGKGGGLL
jgi:hypothetical protein